MTIIYSKDVMQEDCEFCGQPGGELCVTRHGRVLDEPHSKRIEAAQKRRAVANAAIKAADPTQGDPMDMPVEEVGYIGRDLLIANTDTVQARRLALSILWKVLGTDQFLDLLAQQPIEHLVGEELTR